MEAVCQEAKQKRGQPCLTTVNDWSSGPCLRLTLAAIVRELYIACTAASIAPRMPRRLSTSQSKSRETLLYAAFQSRKQTKSC